MTNTVRRLVHQADGYAIPAGLRTRMRRKIAGYGIRTTDSTQRRDAVVRDLLEALGVSDVAPNETDVDRDSIGRRRVRPHIGSRRKG